MLDGVLEGKCAQPDYVCRKGYLMDFESHKSANVMIWIMCVLLLLTVFGARAYDKSQHEKEILNHLSRYNYIVDFHESRYDSLSDSCKETQRLLTECNISTAENYEKYISVRYTSVPAEVAEIISGVVVSLSEKHGLDPDLTMAIIEVESMFDPMAESSKGALGLMQVMPSVWSETYSISNPSDLHDIAFNIDTGISILKHYLEKSEGNLSKALQKYHGANGGTYVNKIYSVVGRFHLMYTK